MTLGGASVIFFWVLAGNALRAAGAALRAAGAALRVAGAALRVAGAALRVAGAVLRVPAFFARFDRATIDLRPRAICFFAEVRGFLAEARETDLAAFRAGAFATLLAFTTCFGRAALVFSGRRLADDFGDDCRAAERLIPFATGLLMCILWMANQRHSAPKTSAQLNIG